MNAKLGKRILIPAVMGLAVLAAAQCRSGKQGGGTPPSDVASTGDPVVLQIKNSVYHLTDFDRYIQTSIGSGIKGMDASVLSRLFDEFIDQKLLCEAAREQGMTVTQADKTAYLARLGEGTLTEEEKAALLAAESGAFIDQILADLYTRQLVRGLTVDEAEVREYYERNQKEFVLPERTAVSQILLRTEQEALEIWEQVRTASEEAFREIARSRSIGPEAAAGGVMGVFKKGELPPEMDAAVLALGEHEVSPIIESSYGFHIFRVDKKYPSETVSLPEAARKIRARLMEIKSEAVLSRHLEELESRLEPVIFPENLPFLYRRTSS